jgi:hypothetical protein
MVSATPTLDVPQSAPVEHTGRGRSRVSSHSFVLVGAVLLIAAGLKLAGQNVSMMAQYSWLHSSTVQTATVVWEMILGIWLISQRGRFLAWVLGLVTFLTFAVVSGSLGFIGQADCGCFGVIKASPWVAFSVDVGALVVLGIAKPRWTGWSVERASFQLAGVATLVLMVSLAVAQFGLGGIDTVLAKLRGLPFQTSPSVLDFGTGEAGTTIDRQLTVKNYKATPLRLIGGTSDCSCLATQSLPITIPANSQAEVTIRLRIPAGTPGELARLVELYTDDPSQPKISLRAVCRVEASADSPPR